MLQAFHGKDWAILQSEKLQALGDRLHFAEQTTPKGFGHAVYQARTFVGDEPFLLLLGDHIYLSETKDRCARQLLSIFETQSLDAVTGVQVTLERHLHLFGVIRGSPVHPLYGTYRSELIVEKPTVDFARDQLATPGLAAGNFLAHFGMHVFSPMIFDSLEYLLRSDLRDKEEIQLTAAQEHLRAANGRSWALLVKGQRHDTGIPYGLMETQLALALNGIHRTEICEAIARILATQARS